MLTQEEIDQFIDKAICSSFYDDDDHKLTDQDIDEVVKKATAEQFFLILSSRDPELLRVVEDKEAFFRHKPLLHLVLKYHPLWDNILFLFKKKHLHLLYALSQVVNLKNYDWKGYANLVRQDARKLYWKAALPEQRDMLDSMCESANASLTDDQRCRPALSFYHYWPVTQREAEARLFGQNLYAHNNAAIKKAVAELYVLLSEPYTCMTYVEFINAEFLRYFRETHQREFPHLPSDAYTFKLFNGLFFPVPTSEDYVGIEKESALQDYLMLFLQHHGLATDVLKWIGFVPNDIANGMVKAGVFFTEGLNNTALFHGKLIHMLQIAIAICAIKDGRIQATKDGIKDILEMLVTLKRPSDDALLWGSLFDSATHSSSLFSFKDPYTLHSAIMHSASKYKIEGLANSLIDTHCRRYIKLVNAYNELGFNLSLASFAEKTMDEELYIFTPPTSIIGIVKQRSKGTLQEHGKRFAVFRKQYCPNRLFKVAEFTPASTPTSLPAFSQAFV